MKYLNAHKVFATFRIKRRFPTTFKCLECSYEVTPKQSRIYNKSTRKYTCYNFYNCSHCGYEYRTNPEIVEEYIPYPRLDDNCFEDKELEITLPISSIYGDNIVDVSFIEIIIEREK